MTGIVCAVLSLALVAAVIALCREVRLRQALARLLSLLIKILEERCPSANFKQFSRDY